MALSRPVARVTVNPVHLDAGLPTGSYGCQNTGDTHCVHFMTTASAAPPDAATRADRQHAGPGVPFILTVEAGEYTWAWTEAGETTVAID